MDQAAVPALLRRDIGNELGKVLGMEWETEEDVIKFQLYSLENDEETSKRSCLSTICKFYDPVGLLTPVTVTAKIILRKIWGFLPKVGWDYSPLTELQKVWSSFRESLLHVCSLKFRWSFRPKDAQFPGSDTVLRWFKGCLWNSRSCDMENVIRV